MLLIYITYFGAVTINWIMNNCLATFYYIHVWYLHFLLWYSHPHNFHKSVIKAVWGEMVILLIVTILINSNNYVQHLGIHHPGNKFRISVFLSQSLSQPVPVVHQNNNHVICPSLHTSQICLQWKLVNHKLDWFPIIWLSLVLKNKWTTNDKREMGTVLEPFFFLSLCIFAVT